MENVVCSMFSVELSDEGKQNGRKRGGAGNLFREREQNDY